MARKYIKNCTGDSCEKSNTISRIIFRVLFYILLVAFAGVSAYMLFFSQYLQINKIEIAGNQELSGDAIRQTIEDYSDENFLGIVSKNNFLIISQNKLSDLLKNNFKKIRNVKVSKKFPDSISINIDERKAVLVWCAGEKCFLLDENGVAYNTADFDSQEITQNHLLKINDISERGLSIGEKIIDSDYEQYVIGIKEALKDINLNIGDQNYQTVSSMSEEIDIVTSDGIWIYFSTDFPLATAVKTLNIVLQKEIPREKLKDVEYIDLHSEGKVFYKFKNAEPESQAG
jgi:cell division septal protein FtsQ